MKHEFCHVDTLHHVVVYLTPEGMKESKIKKDKSSEEDTKDDATARFVAQLGLAGWQLVGGSGDVRPVLFFQRQKED